jgi:hypothetical protein
MDNFLRYSKIIYPRNVNKFQENWLKWEILGLLQYPLKLDKFQLYDQHEQEVCICKFTKEYEKRSKLSGFFVSSEKDNLHMKIFGNLEYIDNKSYNNA